MNENINGGNYHYGDQIHGSLSSVLVAKKIKSVNCDNKLNRVTPKYKNQFSLPNN